MKTKLLLATLFFIFCHNSYAQKGADLSAFHQLFQEVEFDLLHVYTDGRREHGDYSNLDLYPFKGKKIASSMHPLLSEVLENSQEEGKQFYAIYRYYITDELEGLLLRIFDMDMKHNSIHCLVYHNKQNKLVQSTELAYDYYAEGGNGGTQSWITDLNADRIKDVVGRTFYETYQSNPDVEDEFIRIYNDSIFLALWNKDKFKSIGITDTLLRNKFQQQYQYHQLPLIEYPLQKALLDFIHKEVQIEPITEKGFNTWAIQISEAKDLSSIQAEVQRIKTSLGPISYYNINEDNVNYYQKGEKYYALVTQLWSENDAKIALLNIQKKLSNTAHIIHFKEWCPVQKAQSGGYYKCVE